MNSNQQVGDAAGSLKVTRCRDPEIIEGILRRDYFDDPVPYLRKRAIQTFARSWIATQNDVYLMTAEISGVYAGFVFGHTLGPRFWRLFASKHPSLLPALAWARVSMKLVPKLKLISAQSKAHHVNENDLESQIAELEISTLTQPFAWGVEGGKIGIIPLVFIASEQRGKGFASQLLNQISTEMFRDGASSVEAHIDLNNLSSVRTFLKSGFEVYRMSTNDFWARKITPT